MKKCKMIIPIIALILLMSCEKDHDEENDENENQVTNPVGNIDCNMVTFNKTIRPLFDARCLSCHGSNSPDGALSNYTEIKVYADNGKLRDEVLTQKSMPIGTAFTSTELAQVKCWLDAGAPNN